jgi:thioredoxin 1
MKKIEKSEQFEEIVVKNPKLVLIDIYADWCGPCKAMEPTLESLQEKYSDTLDIIKIDADNPETGELTQLFKVRSIPTLLFVKDGEVQEAFIGGKTMSVLEKVINNLK